MFNDAYARPKVNFPSACAALAEVAISTPSARSLILVTIHIPVSNNQRVQFTVVGLMPQILYPT
jgi:hypothetical protein